jgi:hypothetical protein
MMAVVGDLDDIRLADLLYVFGLSGATGELRLRAGGPPVSLHLRGGQLARVVAADPCLRVGSVLRRLGLAAAEAVAAGLRRQAAEPGGRQLGAFLLAAGAVTPDDLAHAAEEQAVTALARVLAAAGGTFAYAPDIAASAAPPAVLLDPQRVLLEAIRRLDELPPAPPAARRARRGDGGC